MFLHFGDGDKKQKIIKAAAEIFAQKGFHQAKIEEIAHEAEVGKGTVYEYFPSKRDLFIEMFQAGNRFYDETLRREMALESSLREKLVKVVSLHLKFFQCHKNIARVMMQEFNHISGDMQQAIMEARHEKVTGLAAIFHDGIEQGIFRDIDCVLVARMFLGAVHSLGIPVVLLDEPLDINALSEKMVDVFLKGIENNT